MIEYPFLTDTFRARCTNVVDGDTIDVFLDAAFHNYRLERLRLLGVDTPEMHAKAPAERVAAKAAKDRVAVWLQDRIAGEWPLKIRTRKADSFGRYLARVWWIGRDGIESDLNADLLRSGLAVPR